MEKYWVAEFIILTIICSCVLTCLLVILFWRFDAKRILEVRRLFVILELVICIISIMFRRYKVILDNTYLTITPLIGKPKKIEYNFIEKVQEESGKIHIIFKK